MCAYGLGNKFFISTDRFSVFFGTMSMSFLGSNQKVRHEVGQVKPLGHFHRRIDFMISEVSLPHSKRDGLTQEKTLLLYHIHPSTCSN